MVLHMIQVEILLFARIFPRPFVAKKKYHTTRKISTLTVYLYFTFIYFVHPQQVSS